MRLLVLTRLEERLTMFTHLSRFVFAYICLSGLIFAQVNEPLRNQGVLPTGEDGRTLNLNFETGDLQDWTATGTAWTDQPVKGGIDQNREFGGGKKSQHTGEFWLGGYEKLGDPPKGSLTSVPFKVTHNWCSFLIGGGSHPETRVELLLADDQKVFYRISGRNREEMQPAVVNLASHVGKKIQIRIVDENSTGWGHVNFDDFRFYAQRPRFELPVLTPAPRVQLGEIYPFENLSGTVAAEKMIVPDGFRVQLAAEEPDVMQPIAMAIDDRGRLWIAEAFEYPTRAKQGEGRDRIVILEDTNLDGVFDSRKVFIEGLNLVSGIELGFGGVWVGAAPYLMFIPDRDGDDVPDTEDPVNAQIAPSESLLQFPKDIPAGATVLLDGFGYEDTHETLNAFIWGPDGWLYGCHGVFTHSRVGKPGTPDDERHPLNAGVWRYHPTRHIFEVYAHGSSNPWGVDFNEAGDAFITACVIPHLYHIIPGARYQRQGGQHFNPHTYDDIKTIAKHRHFVGNQWNNNDRARSDDLGGGHAHAGAMIYLGGREGFPAPEWGTLKKYAQKPGWQLPNETSQQGWPEEFHGKLFMNNIHGNRINIDQLIAEGSGYVGDRYPDFLLTQDKWSQMIYMTYGPDGQMYAIDWYDQNQCHRVEEGAHDRSNGRVFRVSYGNASPVKLNLKDVDSKDLITLALVSENEWFARRANRIIQERRWSGDLSDADAIAAAKKILSEDAELQEMPRRYRLVNSLVGVEFFLDPKYVSQPSSERQVDELVSRIGVEGTNSILRMLTGTKEFSPQILSNLTALARSSDPGADRIRLNLASIAQSIAFKDRWQLLEALTSHPEDAADHNLPLMYWYAMEPLADLNPQRALALAMSSGENIPLLREFMIRRLGSGNPEDSLKLLVEGLSTAKDDVVRLTFLKGIRGAVAGREEISLPEAWDSVYEQLTKPESTDRHFDVYLYALGLGSRFGNESAASALESLVIDESGPYEERKVAFTFLVENDSPELPSIISQLLSGTTLRAEALRAAATIDNSEIALAIVSNYKALNADEQTDARNTLASRVSYAVELLKAADSGKIPKQDLSADLIRQLRNLDHPDVVDLLQKVWGVVRDSDVDRKALIAEYLTLVQSSTKETPDPNLGRAVFAKTCQQCHTLYGVGGQVGPDITGANRKDLNYLLSNVLDPSSVMAKEYQPNIVATDSGRIVTGIVKEETDTLLTLQTANELVVIPVNEIEARKQSPLSMMPDDLLKNLSEHEVRSLIAYLSGSQQVAMQATDANLNRFFNGVDLSGWMTTRQEDQSLWTVENGEIIGRSTGLAHNAFLVSDLKLSNFELNCEVKLIDNVGNSGIQFRSQPLADGEMKGYQADIGVGWWGKLYEERGRALLVNQDNASLVKSGEWNQYTIRAVGPRVQAFLNGTKVIDLVDPAGADSGQIALQLHSGGPMEIRFRDLSVKLLDPVPPFADNGAQVTQWPVSSGGSGETQITWKKHILDDLFRSEGSAIADFDNDGQMDVVGGSQWYKLQFDDGEFQKFEPQPIVTPVEEFDPKGYSNTFCNFGMDVNGDGWIDLVVVDFPGKPTWWFENPGSTGSANSWTKHEITPITNNESPQLLDLTGDGIRELLCGFDERVMGFASPKSLPNAQWKINAVSDPGAPGTDRFSHGIGAGDVNNDGWNDIVITEGWWEAPEGYATDLPWHWHPAPFGPACSQMYVYDFDGDGDNDVLSASAHAYGIWWRENLGSGEDEEIRWETHLIDESFSQTHSLVLADINGDGLPDLVTGKRHWAHGGHDPGGNDPAVVYWFELQQVDGKPVWTKHQIDDNSGVGTQFDVADINGDGLLDIATSNKKGTFLFIQSRE